jgi:hypothetical protein
MSSRKKITATAAKIAAVAEETGTVTAVVPQTANLPAINGNGSNTWLEIAAELDQFFGLPFLRFSKAGEFTLSDVDVVAAGTRCVAHVTEVEHGWRKWLGNKLADRKVGKIVDGFIPGPRGQLGDTDEQQWEIGNDGERRDPWQLYASIPLVRLDTNEGYAFSMSSKGGMRAIYSLVRAYGGRVRDHGETAGLPIVELQPGHYRHRQYGKIFFPDLKIVNWTGGDGKPLSIADDMNDSLPESLR